MLAHAFLAVTAPACGLVQWFRPGRLGNSWLAAIQAGTVLSAMDDAWLLANARGSNRDSVVGWAVFLILSLLRRFRRRRYRRALFADHDATGALLKVCTTHSVSTLGGWTVNQPGDPAKKI
jgi:hypothetical protein